VVVDFLSGASQRTTYLAWEVLDSAGEQVRASTMTASGGRGFDQDLAAGQYRVRVSAQPEYFGSYSLRVEIPSAA
jgi:hypothetical protein